MKTVTGQNNLGSAIQLLLNDCHENLFAKTSIA
jgi:hypothetical protein